MVNTYEKAARIQARRREACKPGIAVAVKRFMKRNPEKVDFGLRAYNT
jgi:hypothetical protein